MSSIKLQPGTLSPPACYDTEQARFEAYVAKIVATIIGGLQWETQQGAPVDLGVYWLRSMSDGRARGPRAYNTTDGRWVPWMEGRWIPDSSGGSANAYTATTGHNLLAGTVQRTGVKVVFIPAATNTGASTLNVDGTGPIQITRHNASDLIAGDLVVNSIAEVVFNASGNRWELSTPVPPPTAGLSTYVELTGAVPAAGASTTLPHGQFKAPEFFNPRLICTAADRGYSIGDRVELTSCFWTGSNTGIPAFTVESDATNLNIIRSSSVTSVFIAPKGGGAAYDVAADMTKWTIKVNCQFLP